VFAVVRNPADELAFEAGIFGGKLGVRAKVVAKQQLIVFREAVDVDHVNVVAGMGRFDAFGTVDGSFQEEEPVATGLSGIWSRRPEWNLNVAQPLEPLSDGVGILKRRGAGENVDNRLSGQAWNGRAADMLERQEVFSRGFCKFDQFRLVEFMPIFALYEDDLRAARHDRCIHGLGLQCAPAGRCYSSISYAGSVRNSSNAGASDRRRNRSRASAKRPPEKACAPTSRAIRAISSVSSRSNNSGVALSPPSRVTPYRIHCQTWARLISAVAASSMRL